ncbi:MAG TPA: hypothetical protein VGM23_00325, partial [Armatimonadota bacterium]
MSISESGSFRKKPAETVVSFGQAAGLRAEQRWVLSSIESVTSMKKRINHTGHTPALAVGAR